MADNKEGTEQPVVGPNSAASDADIFPGDLASEEETTEVPAEEPVSELADTQPPEQEELPETPPETELESEEEAVTFEELQKRTGVKDANALANNFVATQRKVKEQGTALSETQQFLEQAQQRIQELERAQQSPQPGKYNFGIKLADLEEIYSGDDPYTPEQIMEMQNADYLTPEQEQFLFNKSAAIEVKRDGIGTVMMRVANAAVAPFQREALQNQITTMKTTMMNKPENVDYKNSSQLQQSVNEILNERPHLLGEGEAGVQAALEQARGRLLPKLMEEVRNATTNEMEKSMLFKQYGLSPRVAPTPPKATSTTPARQIVEEWKNINTPIL